MSRTTKILAIAGAVIVLVALILGGVYLYLPIGEIDPETGERITMSDYFPVAAPEPDDDGRDRQATTTRPDRRPAPPAPEAPLPKLRKIAEGPVAGFTFVTEDGAGTSSPSTYVRYLGREKGHISQAPLTERGRTLMMNETTRRVYHAHFAGNGSNVIARRLTDRHRAETYHLALSAAAGTSSQLVANKTFVTGRTLDVAVSPDGTRYATLDPVAGGSRVTVRNARGEREQVIFESTLSQWLLQWPAEDAITLVRKPAHNVAGYAYTLDPDTGKRSQLVDDIDGLTLSVNPDRTRALVASSQGQQTRLRVRNLETGTSTELRSATLPEKCSWSNLNTDVVYCGEPSSMSGEPYPDAWYQGEVSFEDELVRIHTRDMRRTELAQFDQLQNGEPIDLIKPQMSPQERYLVFINKKDHSLWAYRIAGAER